MTCTAGPVQLVMSWDMLATLESVLDRLGFDRGSVSEFTAALVGIMRAGPEQFDPHLLPEGGRSFPVRDAEDAGVLAAAIAARVDLLETDNLDDFAIKDAKRIETQKAPRGGRMPRQLFALTYERSDGLGIVIAHPIDAIEWLRRGIRPNPENVRELHGRGTSG